MWWKGGGSGEENHALLKLGARDVAAAALRCAAGPFLLQTRWEAPARTRSCCGASGEEGKARDVLRSREGRMETGRRMGRTRVGADETVCLRSCGSFGADEAAFPRRSPGRARALARAPGRRVVRSRCSLRARARRWLPASRDPALLSVIVSLAAVLSLIKFVEPQAIQGEKVFSICPKRKVLLSRCVNPENEVVLSCCI